ncbi:MAG: SMP-30/gluconolactonase/LRE family protein [Chitinophagaceae bacterium]
MKANVFKGTVEVIARGLQFPEGPAFAQDGSLWLVELKGECLVQYDSGYLKRFHVGGAPNGIAIDNNNKIWFCDAARSQVRMFDPLTQQTSVMANQVEGEELTKPNDLAFDKRGNLVFTCPGESRKEPTGYACVLMNDGSVKKITTGKYFPNGLAFSADGKSLVIAETYQHRLWMGDWDAENAVWTNEKPWCAIGGPDGPGGPDGMAFDKNGNLHVAVYGTSSIRVANKDGMLIDEIPLPAKNPTNCAFDPSGKLGLVVTEAEKGILLSIKKDNF